MNPEEAENLGDVRNTTTVRSTMTVKQGKLTDFRLRSSSPSRVRLYPIVVILRMVDASTSLTIQAAVQHMATYWGILERMPGSQLRLTKVDDEIHEHLRREFPEFDARKPIDEDEMKSRSGKERWRKFMMTYENQISDFNFGTLIRIDSRTEYGEKETIFGQLLSVEMGRKSGGR